jgi:type II secretory pathway component GspD/PulD (secretin)
MRWVRRLLNGLLLGALVMGVQAGGLVTRTLDCQVGRLTESVQALNLAISEGSVTFSKQAVLWYTVDPKIDTFLKAARKAILDDRSDSVVRRLLEASIRAEPATAEEARKMLDHIEAASQDKAAHLAMPNGFNEPLSLEVPAAAAPRTVVVPAGPPVGVNLSLDQTDFEGFINYNTYAVSNGKLFTFPIPQPIFSRRHIDTAVTVNGGPTIQFGGL